VWWGEVIVMKDDVVGVFDVFDGDDVDVGEELLDDDDISDVEVVVIRVS